MHNSFDLLSDRPPRPATKPEEPAKSPRAPARATGVTRSPDFVAFCDRFRYDKLCVRFPLAKIFRAGVLVICEDAGAHKLLLVHQNATYVNVSGARKRIPPRRGLPKGSRDSIDPTAVDTAMRELFEETNIRLLTLGARISQTPFIINRPEVGEVTIYFLALLAAAPPVTVDGKEIRGYSWVDVGPQLRTHADATIPTQMMFDALVHVDLSEITNMINIAE